jgi:predicted nucleic acid-binding protein
MPFVLDASIALCWAFDDEGHPRADLAMERLADDEAVVPSLLWFEVRNTLIMSERRSRLSEEDSGRFLFLFSQLPVRVDREPVEGSVLSLARKHKITVYDAAYLELAQRESLRLATLDAELVRAARAEGVPLLEES